MFESISVVEIPVPQVLVVGCFEDAPIDGWLKKLPFAAEVKAAADREECRGKSGKIAEAFPKGGVERVIVVGLGKKGKLTAGDLRSIGAAVGRRLAWVKATTVRIQLGGALDETKVDARQAGQSFGEALGLLSWDNTVFKGAASANGNGKKPARMKLKVDADKGAFKKGLEAGLALGEAANIARSLSETPPNIATPDYMAEQCKKLAKACGLKFSVMTGKELEKEKLVGHINVGKASENKPAFIRLEYTPKKGGGAKGKKPVVLIGKTMTYDTGGLSLKVNNGMVGMKRDKDGGCAVIGAMHAIATLVKPSRPVVALLCSAENSVSDEAYRPDDIITYRNGVTVEITNTDAEGRLVLADGFCWACDKEDPAYIVELSTLTGGVVTALGSTFCGMFCDDDALRAKVEKAAEASGERVWRLPMHQEYRDMMKSPVADILNSNPNRKAHAGQGAAFLSYFVKDGIPWCHLDIAGVHASEADSGMFVKGPTGFGTRLLAALLGGE